MATTSKKSGKKKGKMLLFLFEIIIILMMVLVLWMVTRTTESEGPKLVYIDPEDLEIPEEVKEKKVEGGTMHGYMNIALFGLDLDDVEIKTYTEQQLINRLYKNSRSDTIMIASINLDSGDVKLVSVYRDTYLNLSNDSYDKCNHAYSYGGAEQAIKMLNMNLDMDIEKFVTVNYKALVDAIDGLGGVWIDVDEAELKHINTYQTAVATNLNRKDDYIAVTETGYQLLNGLQATAYCRIRQTRGDDFQRAARQREVVKEIAKQAKQTSLTTLTQIFNDCIGYVYTNIDSADILNLIGNITTYNIVAEDGFPQEGTAQEPLRRSDRNMGAKGSCVVPNNLEANVEWLHEFLFGDENYEATDRVKEYSAKIYSDASNYFDNLRQ